MLTGKSVFLSYTYSMTDLISRSGFLYKNCCLFQQTLKPPGKHEIIYQFSDEQADELERKCKEIFPKPESNVSDYIALTLNEYRKAQKI